MSTPAAPKRHPIHTFDIDNYLNQINPLPRFYLLPKPISYFFGYRAPSKDTQQKYRNEPYTKEYAKHPEAQFTTRRRSSLLDTSFKIEPKTPSSVVEIEKPASPTYSSGTIAQKQNEIYEQRKQLASDGQITEIMGWFLVGFAAILFISVFYAIIVSPFIGETGHILLDFIRTDN